MRPIGDDTEIPDDINPDVLQAWEDTLVALQGAYDAALERFQTAQQRVNEFISKQTQWQRELDIILAQLPGAQGGVEDARRRVSGLFVQREEYRAAHDAATARLLGTDRLDGMVSTAYPLLLLPVRLETRFVSTQGGTGTELLLRIYPDDVQIDTHEPELTVEEERWGRHFWEQGGTVPPGSEQVERQRQAWQQLVERFDAPRAAWIVRVLDPAGTSPILRRDGTWTRAPHTQVLPDRWVAIGYREQQPLLTAWGKPIPDLLPCGLSPQASPILDETGLPPIDEGMRWLLDFSAAEAVGMALRIPLTEVQATSGFERLVVLGVKASLDEGASAARLTQLLDAHHYTGGLAFVGQNLPTNNTAEVSSGYRSSSRDAAGTFGVELADPLAQPGTDGELTARALGIPPTLFAHVRGADGTEQQQARAINATFLTASDSALLRQLLAVMDPEVLSEHFQNFVRARGPLPALRIDSQPYGLLPAIALDRWPLIAGNNPSAEMALANWWRAHRQEWRYYAVRSLNVGHTENPLLLLAQEANACQYVMRELPEASAAPLDPRPLETLSLRDLLLNRALDLLQDPASNVLKTLPDTIRQALIAEVVDLLTSRFDAWATSLATSRLAQLRQDHPTGIRLGGYGWVEDLKRGVPWQPVESPPAGVTQPLYRSEANQGYVQAPSLAHAATAAVLRSGYLSHQQEEDSGESPFAVDLSSDRVRRAKWMLDGVRQGQSLAALLGYRFERGLHEQGLDRYIHQFRTLASLKADDELAKAYDNATRAERIAREVDVLYAQRDQSIHRAEEARAMKAEREAKQQTYQQEIDAINALTQQAQAAEARVSQLTQIITQYQGAKPQSRVNPGGRRYDVDLIEEQDLEEWVNRLQELREERATAQAEAIEARAAYNTRAADRRIAQVEITKLLDPSHPDSIAAAQQMITIQEAMAADSDLQGLAKEGGIRGKAQADLTAARTALAASLNQQWGQALESLAANAVVDGLELHRRWKEGQRRKLPQSPWDATTIPFGDAVLGFPIPGSDDFIALNAQLRALDEMVDAVGDTVIAESVYQIVQGNPLRAGATLDAIATGEMSPPELEVIRTPRTGIGLTHRLCVMFPITAGIAPPAWSTNAQQVRAQAEPILNAWAAMLLPRPEQVRCQADFINSQDNRVYHSTEIALVALELSPLDTIFMAEGQEESQRSELEQRLLYHLFQTRPTMVPADAEVRLSFARQEGWAEETVSFGEFLEMTRTIRRLLSSARSLDGRDLSLPESSAQLGLDVQELTQRTTQAQQSLTQAQQALQSLLPTEQAEGAGVAVNLEALRGALLQMAAFGIQGAVPLSVMSEGYDVRSTLLRQARSVAKEVGQRLQRMAELDRTFDPANATPEVQREHNVAHLKEIFGPDFRVLPHVMPTNAASLVETFEASLSLQANDPLAATTWFQRASYVRGGVQRLNAAMIYAEMLGDGAHLNLQVGQLPYSPGNRWVALPSELDPAIPTGKLSLVAQMAQPLRFDQPFAGLLIDEWVEVVPNRSETTGLTFHYDQPNSAAPQALLLAVPADERAVWDLASLEAVLRETLELVQLRAVAVASRPETIWIEDALPEGATPLGDGEAWIWVRLHPEPLSGKLAHQSALVTGLHQHYFQGAKASLPVSVGDQLFAHIYLDPNHLPQEVMLQWHDGTWEHRAYWGENFLDLGTDGTVSRWFMGSLPPPGQWVRLEVPAALVGLEGRVISGMAFTLWDGRATWDRVGKVSQQPADMAEADLSMPALFFDGSAIDLSSVVETGTGL
jgi:hypothetical protein